MFLGAVPKWDMAQPITGGAKAMLAKFLRLCLLASMRWSSMAGFTTVAALSCIGIYTSRLTYTRFLQATVAVKWGVGLRKK